MRSRFSLLLEVSFATILFWVLVPSVSFAQSQWTKSAGIKASAECRLASQHDLTLLYSPTEVFMSDNGGFIWWSVKDKFPNGLTTACVVSGKLVGLSVGSDRTVQMHSTSDGGTSWNWQAVFTLDEGEELVEVTSAGRHLLAYTKQGVIYNSEDLGETWKRIRIQKQIGEVVDITENGELWIACGTEAVTWSADGGLTWSYSTLPFQMGGTLTTVEVWNNEIWGGSQFGAARFDVESRSWMLASKGLDNTNSRYPQVIELKELGGVLFGLFRNISGANACYQWTGSEWLAVAQGGLPYGNPVSRFRFSIWRDLLQVYCTGSDLNLKGVYTVHHNAITHVTNDVDLNVQLSPIPATDHLLIQRPNSRSMTVAISDVSGKVEMLQTIDGSGFIDTSLLPSGTYTLQLRDGESTVIRPILIQR